MIRVCETGRNPTMRHLGRTHAVSVGLDSPELDGKPVMLRLAAIDQQLWGTNCVADAGIQIAVIVDVPDGDAAADPCPLK